MTIYVVNTYTAPSVLQPVGFDRLMHEHQKVTTDKNEAIKYAKNAIDERSEMYKSDVFSDLFGKNIREKHEDDTLMHYSVGPREKGLYMLYIQIREYEV